MTERDNILGRIREALRVPAPRPGSVHNGSPPRSRPTLEDLRQLLPSSGRTFEDRLALFRKNASELRAEFHLVQDLKALAVALRQMRDAEGWKKIGLHGSTLTDFAGQTLSLPACRTDHGYAVRELENCDAGITECDALVAQTGSVLVTSRSSGGRALSVLPPHHVVLAQSSQLLADLPEAFSLIRKKYASGFPSFISFITGPSRTGDIERILVLGAHGPKKLTIFCLQSM